MKLSLQIILCLFLPLSILTSLNKAVDTISYNQSLSGNQTLVSKGGNFVLGFFQPGNSSNYYLGIWYNTIKIPVFTQVWVANREKPLSDRSLSELRISSNGNMVLLNESKASIWSTDTTFDPSYSLLAILHDDGNFVLVTTSNSSNSSSMLWQSFDHMSDTLLPRSKIKLNKLTHEIQGLTSWKSSYDPAPGVFSMSPDLNGLNQFVMLWNESVMYFETGIWNGNRFEDIPEMTPPSQPDTFAVSYEFVGNDSEMTFTYKFKYSSHITFARVTLSISGQAQLLIWVANTGWMVVYNQPRSVCGVYGVCGPFASCDERVKPMCNCIRGFSQASPKNWELGNYTSGCVRNTALYCSNSKSPSTDKFYEMEGVSLVDHPRTIQIAKRSDCESACLRNCSCVAYSYNFNCSLWFRDLLNIQQLYAGSADTLYVRVAASELKPSKSKEKKTIFGVVIGAALVSFSAFFVCGLVYRRRLSSSSSNEIHSNLAVYKYAELKRSTKNFTELLGEGGFGSVFKGLITLPDTQLVPVAVKKLKGIYQGDKQFRAEVSTLGTIQHVNLVRLRGFCSEGTQQLLVYDYMPNGSLAYQLFNNLRAVLDWNTRYRIALGSARGLAYLHERCRDRIIHCDIKPENILLDSSFNPKVADFGLAKLVGRNYSRVLTTMRGTLGYLAPEWISGVAITTKADVYSYGLMLFEIISGKRNWGSKSGSVYFPLYAAYKLQEGDILPILDDRLEGEVNIEDVRRACLVACWCIQDDESVRPTMGQVVQILEKVLDVEMPTIPRLLQLYVQNTNSIDDSGELQSGSSIH